MSINNQFSEVSNREVNDNLFLIDSRKIALFFYAYARYLVLGIVVGFLLGLVFVWLLPIKHELHQKIVINKIYYPNTVSNSGLLQYQNIFEVLAQRASDISAITTSEEDKKFYSMLANKNWWEAHLLKPDSISKNDIKDVAGLSQIDRLNLSKFHLKIESSSVDDGIKAIIKIDDFVRNSGIVNLINDLIEYYQNEINRLQDIENELFHAERKNIEAQKMLANLESLKRSYPDMPGANNVITNINSQLQMNYLPLNNQLIGIRLDILINNDVIKDLKNRLIIRSSLEKFIYNLSSLVNQNIDNNDLFVKISRLEDSFLKELEVNNLSNDFLFEQLMARLKTISNLTSLANKNPLHGRAQFVKIKKNYIKYVGFGILGGGILSLFVCLGMQFWPSIRRSGSIFGKV
jgi:hypothetical protein